MVTSVETFVEAWRPWLVSGAVLAVAALAGLVTHAILFRIARKLIRSTEMLVDDVLVQHCRSPLRLIFPLFFLQLAIPLARVGTAAVPLHHLVGIGLIVAVAWLLIGITSVVEFAVLENLHLDARDNLRARKAATQIRIVKRIVIVGIFVLAFGAILMSFERLRQLGTGLLASAGVAGLVVGFAAQRTLGNLLAGVQIALTQPIRLDDVVIVEGEWGRIEEITLTYVVVRIWDLRRLVVPIGYFMDKPFENWTRVSADLLGTVFLRVDFTVPVAEIRQALEKMVKESQYWDGKVVRLHVTDADDRTVELRALMSAADSSAAWELRCEIRERLISYVQEHYPDALPRLRASLDPADSGPQAPPSAAPVSR